MWLIKRKIKQYFILLLSNISLVAFNPVFAESDVQMYEQALKAREMKSMDHTNHAAKKEEDETGGFKGVFYGNLPCNDCNGLKMTLSLKQRDVYLLVSQYARESSREDYEKGKYNWDEKTSIVTLTPKKKDLPQRHFRIKDEATLVQVNADGSNMSGSEDSYTLKRSDTAKGRQVHIH